MMVMQYPVMSGSTLAISSVNGGVQVMEMLEPSVNIKREPTASRRPKSMADFDEHMPEAPSQ